MVGQRDLFLKTGSLSVKLSVAIRLLRRPQWWGFIHPGRSNR
jgi:hypothetical protein